MQREVREGRKGQSQVGSAAALEKFQVLWFKILNMPALYFGMLFMVF